MKPPVTDKASMYRQLAAGAFGNTLPLWFDLESWEASPDYARYDLWGVRTQTPGGPCRLNTPRDEVRSTVGSPLFRPHAVSLSLMASTVFGATLHADVSLSEAGLMVYGVENPPHGASWREIMPRAGRTFGRLASTLLLRRHLNANSHDDLMELLEAYPGHVVELTTLPVCYGTVPHRNAVIWEVRVMDGSYERPTWRPPHQKPDGE